MVSHAHITRLRPRHAYFSADSGCDRSGVAINVIFLIFSQIVTVWILVPGRAHKRITAHRTFIIISYHIGN